MATGGHIGNNAKFGFSAGSSPYSWRKVEQVLDITPPVLTNDKIETTVHSTGGFHRSIPGLSTVSDAVVKMLRDNYISTSPNQNALFGYISSRTKLHCRFEIPADADLSAALYEAYEFDAYVMEFAPTAPIGGAQEVSVKLVFDGSFYSRFEPAASQIG